MKTEERAAQAIKNDPKLRVWLTPVDGGKASRWKFKAGDAGFEADVAFQINKTSTWLFVEPDDAARAPQNVAKYLMWMEKNGIADHVHLIHPIGPRNDSAWGLACFLGERMNSLHRQFSYHPFRVKKWNEDQWVARLVQIAKDIAKQELANQPVDQTQ